MPLTLLLLRHAKSEWSDDTVTDHDRPISVDALSSLSSVVAHMVHNKLKPDLVLCSTALRARQTLETLKSEWSDLNIKYEESLYIAQVDAAYEVLRVSGNASTVLLVGHNPTIEHLLLLTVDRDSQTNQYIYHEASIKYPTGTLAEISLNIDQWSNLGKNSGELINLVVPNK